MSGTSDDYPIVHASSSQHPGDDNKSENTSRRKSWYPRFKLTMLKVSNRPLSASLYTRSWVYQITRLSKDEFLNASAKGDKSWSVYILPFSVHSLLCWLSIVSSGGTTSVTVKSAVGISVVDQWVVGSLDDYVPSTQEISISNKRLGANEKLLADCSMLMQEWKSFQSRSWFRI